VHPELVPQSMKNILRKREYELLKKNEELIEFLLFFES